MRSPNYQKSQGDTELDSTIRAQSTRFVQTPHYVLLLTRTVYPTYQVKLSKDHSTKSIFCTYHIEEGRIIWRSKAKKLRNTSSNQYRDTRDRTIKLEITAAMDFLPDSSSLEAKISAYFKQIVTLNESHTLHSAILLHMMVPSDSEVFNCVERGDLECFRRLLQDGKASLRTCDERGRSLLTVTMIFQQ